MSEALEIHSPTVEEIAICAYLIWRHEGYPENRDKVHWDQAEVQLTICHAHDCWISAHRSRASDT
jgi:hypothetical protein